MLSALYWVALLGVVLQLAPDGRAQHLPREIEEGPDGSIVINLGGVPDPRASGFNSPGLALLRAKSRGVATRKLDESNGLNTAGAVRLEERNEGEEEYDYDSYTTKPAQTTMRRTRKPKKAKSKRPSLLEWFSEWVGKPSTPTEKGEEEKRTPSSGHSNSKAFGANRLFSEKENGQRRPLPTAETSLLDIDAPNHAHNAPKHHHNSLARQGPQQLKQISSQRLGINQGCREWSSFHRMTGLLTKRRQNLVEGNVQKASESTAPLDTSTDSQASLAVLGPKNSSSAPSLLPLPECFLNQLGMVCCNRVVEEMIYRANDAMINANVNKCNIGIFSQLLRDLLEKQFQTTFEVIVANGDFAAKVRFKDNLLCKTVATGKYVLAYGTPEPYTLVSYNVEKPLSA